MLDLDGTLINSEKAFFESFKNILQKEFNINITKEDYKNYELEQNGMLLKTLRDINQILENITDKEVMSLIYEDYEKEFRSIILEKEAKDNFNLLKELKKLKLSLALVTTCRRHYLNILIDELELENLFDVIVAREDVKNLKPAPDAYLDAINYLKLQKNNCISFEDSKRGIDSAIDSGLKVVQVSNFTSIKFIDDRAIQFESANEVLKKMVQCQVVLVEPKTNDK